MITINGDMGVADSLKSQGYQPAYATCWLGPWITADLNISAFLTQCDTRGVAPAFNLFYWGDEIALETLKGTYVASEYGGKTESVGEYWALVKRLAAVLKAHGTTNALVSIEGEWNKRGPNLPNWLQSVTADPSVFDKLFADTANYLKTTAPGTKIVTCPGQWDNLATLLPKFPQMMKTADYLATQGLNTLYRQSEDLYIKGVDRLLGKMQELQTAANLTRGDNMPLIIMDTAWSSYSGSYVDTGNRDKDKPFNPIPPATIDSNLKAGENSQRLALEHFRALLPQFEGAGLKHLFYRSVNDAKMDIKNYWGYFEWGWGVIRSDGSKKPAFDSLMSLVVQPSSEVDALKKDMAVLQAQLKTAQHDLDVETAFGDGLMTKIQKAKGFIAQAQKSLE